VAVLGRNGVGKTTLLKALMGLVRVRSGTVRYRGERIDRLATFEIARRGIRYIPQGREIFGDQTVEENLFLGDLAASNADDVFDIFPALAAKRDEPAGTLSGGQQQQLAIGRALMGRPTLLLLDEPSDGIQPSLVAELTTVMKKIMADRRMALILVEQNIDMALSLCSRALFMDHGHALAGEDSETLRRDPSLIETHLAI
jgi:ABC-type branched-subunit amino acid transport system ATPase component